MVKEVPDTEENMEICKQYCGPCPSFKPNDLNEVEPHALFCARGASKKPKEEIEDNGCSCMTCVVFEEYDLEDGWFCMEGKEGR